jgi:DNA primase
MSAIDEIKAKVDIVSYIQRTVPLKRAGRVYKACCPFHHERTPSFVVNPDNQTWRCFGACAEGGDLFRFAMKQNGWTFREALEELGRLAGVEVRPQTPEQRAADEASDRLRGLMKAAAEFYHQRLLDPSDRSSQTALSYVTDKRGLSGESISRFQIGYAPQGWDHLLRAFTALGYSADDLISVGLAKRNDEGRVYDAFRNRLMIPICDERGRAIGFGARALDPDDTPKYLNSPQSSLFDKGRTLFALHHAAAAIRASETVVIVEGYLDAIQAHQAGYSSVVAQMGTALTEPQLRLVAPRWAKTVILALDSDAAGQNATRRSLEVARAALQADYAGRLGVEFRVLSVPDAKDPDDLIRENPAAWQAMVADAKPVADFIIGLEVAGLPPNPSVQQREAAARRLLPLLIASEDSLYRSANIQQLALALRLPERDLLMWTSDQQKIARAARLRPQPGQQRQDFTSDRPVGAPIAAPVRLSPSPTETDIEAYCLQSLFEHPDYYYEINRKLRKLAEADPALGAGPLADFSPDDFVQPAYRELMRLFLESLAQVETDFVEYVEQRLDDVLFRELSVLLRPRDDATSRRIGGRLKGDLAASLKQNERMLSVIDHAAELVDRALHLRERRLSRERQEIVYLQADGDRPSLQEQAIISLTAKRLIDNEIGRQTKPGLSAS